MATHRRAQTDHYPSHVSGRPDHLIRSRVRCHCRLVEPPLSQKRSGQARDSLSRFSIVNAILGLSSRFDFYRTLWDNSPEQIYVDEFATLTVAYNSRKTAARMRKLLPHFQAVLLPDAGHVLLGMPAQVVPFLAPA